MNTSSIRALAGAALLTLVAVASSLAAAQAPRSRRTASP